MDPKDPPAVNLMTSSLRMMVNTAVSVSKRPSNRTGFKGVMGVAKSKTMLRVLTVPEK
jgi:hypothetical protein